MRTAFDYVKVGTGMIFVAAVFLTLLFDIAKATSSCR